MSARFPLCVGFDVLADKIRDTHRSIYPLNLSVVGAVLAVGRKVKSLFMVGSGKQKVDQANLLALSATPAKQRSSCPEVTPASGDTAVDEYIYPTLTLCITPLPEAMIINFDCGSAHLPLFLCVGAYLQASYP
jgi:hypothetical protein